MTILSKKQLLELEEIMNKLDEFANDMESEIVERSDRWQESPKGELWVCFQQAVQEAHDALETAEWPEH